jgi:hypothetical protein
MRYDDEADQGFSSTDHCTRWDCGKPTLVKRGKFWCCPKCGSSYGENPCRRMNSQTPPAAQEHP